MREGAENRTQTVAGAFFLAVSLALVVLPLVGMAWARTDSTTENRQLAAAPSLLAEDGSLNVSVLSDAGSYFEDHFAYRNEAVAANAHLLAALGSSSTDQVVVGSGDWLYYGGTLNDYLGRSALSDRALAGIAHNLRLAQGYVESRGARFAFAIAPNKATLYAEGMPARFLASPEPSNAERLEPFLEAEGVGYVNLFDALSASDEVLYLRRDTHWSNQGAVLGGNALLESVGRDALDVDPAAGELREDFVGDLQRMLYPGEERAEENAYYPGYHDSAGEGDGALSWRYVEGDDVEDSWIRTSGAGEGSLLMFRDSFGNALVPFFAGDFAQAAFSKLVPYNLPLVAQVDADFVFVERAERHLSDLFANPPIVPAPVVSFASGLPPGARELPAAAEVVRDGPYWVVRGDVDGELPADARIYLSIRAEGADPVLYEPFWTGSSDENGQVGGDCGFLAYIPASSAPADDLSDAVVTAHVLGL